MELSKKLGFKYNWIKEKKDTLKTHSPMKKTFDDFYTRLSKKYKEMLTRPWKTIENKFQNLYKCAFPTETNLLSSIINKPIRRQFFDEIKEIIKNYYPNIRIFDTDLSAIFFRRARALKDSHLKGDFKFRRFDPSTLFRFIYKTRFLTKNEFVKKIRDIESVDKILLEKIKIDIENHIEQFIFGNPYTNRKYFNDRHAKGSLNFKLEYDLTLKIWIKLSKVENGPILLKNVRKALNYDTFGRLTKFGQPNKGKVYSWDGLMNMLKKLITLLPSKAYSETFEQVWNYIEQRNLYPTLPRIYHPGWYTESTLKFHIIILLIRDLGLDILNLKPIKPESFKKTDTMESQTYERHHIYINNKQSIDVNRLALVMHSNHSNLEGKTDLVLLLIQNRIELACECPQYYKENVKKCNQKWLYYLERRNYLIENGIENFITNYYTDDDGNNYILNRFFKNVPKGQIEQEIKKMMQEWIDKGRPAPILNKYILNRLFFGTPNLLTSGYSEIKF